MKNAIKLFLILSVICSGFSWATPNAMPAKPSSNICDSEFHYSEIGKKELTKVSADKTAFVIDVNSAESFKKNHVTNAVHFESIRGQFAKSLPTDKNKLIVAYCGGPKCGAWMKAASEACKLGYKNIKHYKGGIQGWVKN